MALLGPSYNRLLFAPVIDPSQRTNLLWTGLLCKPPQLHEMSGMLRPEFVSRVPWIIA
jgi:hypothetical protein